MDRKREQAELMFQLGTLFGPLVLAAQHPERYDADERVRMHARYCHEFEAVRSAFARFCKGEAGHTYRMQEINFHRTLLEVSNDAALAPAKAAEALAILQSIPIPTDSIIYEARTPYRTYRVVRDMCATVSQRVTWLDRYFDQNVFHRFLEEVPASAEIMLVTWPRTRCSGRRDEARYEAFIDVSRLFAAERGPEHYRLVTNEDFHDRWLRCDKKLYAMGGSIKDLQNQATFTLSSISDAPDNHRQFDEAIAEGTEIFGPSAPEHP